MQIDRAIEYFLSAKKGDGARPATIRTYDQHLRRFVDAMPEVGDTDDLDVPTIRSYILKLQDDHRIKPVSRASRVVHLKAFCNWLEREELIKSSPFARGRVKVPAFERKNVATITDEEFRALLAACDTRLPVGRRDTALLMFLMDTGVRVGELVGLNIEDVNFTQRTAQLRHTKGKRERTVFFSPYTATALTRYLGRTKGEEGPLFGPVRSKGYIRLEANAVNQRLRILATKAGLDPQRVHPHAFRHTMATNYLREGGDPASLQAILGHADVSTTVKNYVHLVTGDLSKKHDQFSSMGRLMRKGH